MPNLHRTIINFSLTNVAALTALDVTFFNDGILAAVYVTPSSENSLYIYDKNSSQTADGDRVVTSSNGVGRWIKITSENLQNLVTNLTTDDDTRPLAASQGVALQAQIDMLDAKDSVDVATTEDIILNGEQTIDGVLTNQSRVLVWKQANQTENGVYITNDIGWLRASDADTADKLFGAAFWVTQGDQYGLHLFNNFNPTLPVLGIDNILFGIVAERRKEYLTDSGPLQFQTANALTAHAVTGNTLITLPNDNEISGIVCISVLDGTTGVVTFDVADGGTINNAATIDFDLSTFGQYTTYSFISDGANNWSIYGAWSPNLGASNITYTTITSADSPYTASWDEVVLCSMDNNIIVQLPAVANNEGRTCAIKRIDGDSFTLFGKNLRVLS